MWKFLVKNQSIEILEREVLADHQIQYVQFRFTFDGDWKRFHKVVQFSQCDETYSIMLGTGGTTLYLPAELHVGAVKMSVFGYDTASDTIVRATTVPVTLNIRHSGFVGDDDTPIPPTPDLYQQLLRRIEDAEKGLDGKSAYEIAVAHGFVGTEAEWLASLHGADGKDGITPDMSEYPKTADVASIVQQEIAPVAEEAHAHDNKATLDAITPELFSDLDGLQQFEDQTQYNLQTIEESLLPLQQKAHTHDNQSVLDQLTQAMIEELATISTVVEQAHWHHNLTVLNSITAAKLSTLEKIPDLQAGLAGLTTKEAGDFKSLNERLTADENSAQQFQDSTTERLHTAEEMLNNFSNTAHTHHNKDILDGIIDAHIKRWNDAYTNAMNLNERISVHEGVFERFKTEILYDMQGCKTAVTDHAARLTSLEQALAGLETALAEIVEVTT